MSSFHFIIQGVQPANEGATVVNEQEAGDTNDESDSEAENDDKGDVPCENERFLR